MLFYFFKVLLLFLLGVQKKKVTKRKTPASVWGRLRSGSRRKRRNSLRSNSLRFFSPLSAPPLFRPQTKAGTIFLCRDARSVRPKNQPLIHWLLNHPHTKGQGIHAWTEGVIVGEKEDARAVRPYTKQHRSSLITGLPTRIHHAHNLSPYNTPRLPSPVRNLYNHRCRDARSVRPKNQPTIHWLLNHPHTWS